MSTRWPPKRARLRGKASTLSFAACVRISASFPNALLIKAALPEADLTVNGALCAGVTPQKHEAALETMRSCQIEVL